MHGTAILFITFLLYEKAVSTYSVDQRQTGDLNVQIDLKNLQVIALMKGKEEYVDYDYAYDYSDITIKPQNGTTKKPINVTETSTLPNKDNTTSTTVTSLPELITTLSHHNVNLTAENVPTTNGTNNEDTSLRTTTVSLTLQQENNSSNVNTTTETTAIAGTLNTTSPSVPENCKKGFHRNSNGNCELILQNPSHTLLKMLKQKARPGNGSRRT